MDDRVQDKARMAPKQAGKGKALENSSQDTSTSSFWLPLLQSSCEEAGLDEETYLSLRGRLKNTLDEQFTVGEELLELLSYDEDALEDRIASESRGLKRDTRKTSKKQQFLEEEQERLDAFRPSRKAAERDEAAEIAEKLHPLARQFSSKKASARRSMSSQALQDMERAKRELDSLEEGLQAYTPEEDDFLQDLLARVDKPRGKKKHKQRQT